MARVVLNVEGVEITADIMSGGDNIAYGVDKFYTSRLFRFVASVSSQRDEGAFVSTFGVRLICGIFTAGSDLKYPKVVTWAKGDQNAEISQLLSKLIGEEKAKFI